MAVGVDGTSGRFPAEAIKTFLGYNFVETVAKVSGQGAASCFSCGYGETCRVGLPVMAYGAGVRITGDMVPDVARQPEVMQAAADAGRLLGARLRGDHDRQRVTTAMRKKMMERMKPSA